MIVKYFESEMNEIEKRNHSPFVGYINPRGQLIDYTTLVGLQTHCNSKNPASMMFLQFVSYIIKGFSPNELRFFWDKDGHIYRNNKTTEYEEVVKRGFDCFNYYNTRSYDDFLQKLDMCYEIRKKLSIII